MVSMVVKVLEAMMNSVVAGSSALQRVVDMRAVDIGDVVRARAVMIGRQRQRRHGRAEIGAADADVDDVGDLLAGRAGRRAGAHGVGEGGHRIEHGMDVGDDVVAVEQQRLRRAVRAAPCAARRGPR